MKVYIKKKTNIIELEALLFHKVSVLLIDLLNVEIV